MRKAYGPNSLELFLESSLTSTEPLTQFHEWFKYAEKNCKLGFEEINAMALSTATKYCTYINSLTTYSFRDLICENYFKRWKAILSNGAIERVWY